MWEHGSRQITFKNQEKITIEGSSFNTNPKGIIATRAWFFDNLSGQFDDSDNSKIQQLVQEALDGIELQSLATRKNKEDIVLAFGRNICF
mgnify:CR=1 FL=1